MNRQQKNPRSAIVPVAGDRQFSRLINAVQSHFVELTFTGTLTIATAVASSIRSRGSILAAFDEVGIDENGTDRWINKGVVARVLHEMASVRPTPVTRLTSTAIGATSLRETVRIYFAHPYAALPRETAFTEKDTRQLLQVFVKLAASGGADKIAVAGGGGTVTLTNLKVAVTHGYDAQESDRPYFIPVSRQIVAQVAGAQTALQTFLKTSNAIRAMVVSQEDTNVGEVTDVINAYTLRGDFRDLTGPGTRNWKDAVDASQMEFGGDMSSYAHLGINFQQHGRLAAVLNPNQDNNLRFEFDCQPTAASGAGTSQIRVTTVELIADPALCKPLDIPV